MEEQEAKIMPPQWAQTAHLSAAQLHATAAARSFTSLAGGEREHLEHCRPCLLVLDYIVTLLRIQRQVNKN